MCEVSGAAAGSVVPDLDENIFFIDESFCSAMLTILLMQCYIIDAPCMVAVLTEYQIPNPVCSFYLIKQK